ncbi:MAG: DUF1778 domain-containing protein [Hyphomicrobiaceae bacterium]
MSDAAVMERRANSETATTKKTSINIRVPEQTRQLIDNAAAVVGKTRTEFMLESARQHAIDVLLDQRLFFLDEDQLKAFMAVLQNPPRANRQLKKLFMGKAPWEK